MRRRDFIRTAFGASAGLLLPVGCDSDPVPMDAGVDAFVPPPMDAGAPELFRGVTKGPFVHLLGDGRARLRFETRIDEPVPVRIERPGGADDPVATRVAAEIEYQRDALGMADRFPDPPGPYVLHDVVIEDLELAESVAWTVTPEVGEAISGSFKAPVAPDAGFSFAWLSDTSLPFVDPHVTALMGHDFDLVMHGGDITYQANPFDTWNGVSQAFGPLMRRAPMHFTIGNHEFDALHEVDQMYDRLFSGQGEEGGSTRFFAYTYGGVRFIHLDTETADIDVEGQLGWLDAELAAQEADPDILYPIVMFHRPTYTFSKHAPGNLATRMAIHERCQTYRVPLVFAGHAHCYERFEVDGVTYIVDGGGGAVVYDPDEDLEAVRAMRPDEIALRQHVEGDHGFTRVEVGADGGLTLTRYQAESGAVQDMVAVTRPS